MATYNGWTNYATWRINLEIFSEGDMAKYCYESGMDADDIDAAWAKEWVEELLFGCLEISYLGERETSGIGVESYARAFISDVNWYEIASHIAEDVKERKENEDD